MSAAESIVPRKIWTRAEVDRLPSDTLSLELVNGELIDRMGKRPPHIYWKSVLQEWLVGQFGFSYVRSEDPIDVAPEDNPTSEPEPDLLVSHCSVKETRGVNPAPQDLRLVVEISDRTFLYDTSVKAELYARAGIREYWVIDVRSPEAPRLLLHLDPRDGLYRSVTTHAPGENIGVLDGLLLNLKLLM